MVSAGVGSGCQELPVPSWVLDDTATMQALRIEVIEEGELSALVGPVPADRTRHEALPGDTISFTPWVASGERTFAPEEVDVAYFVCLTFDCYGALTLPEADLPCRDEIDPTVPICAAGRGPSATYRLPTRPLTAAVSRVQVLAIAGAPGRGDTDACIEIMRNPPYRDLGGCMLLERTIPIGPYWVATLALDPEERLPPSADPDAPTIEEVAAALAVYQIPLEVLAEWPDLNPEVESFTVGIVDGGELQPLLRAEPGDTLRVEPGMRVQVTVDVDPRDRQRFAVFENPETGEALRDGDIVNATWFANRELSGFLEPGMNGLGVGVNWRAREGDGEVRIDALVRDQRNGVAWGSLVFVIDGEGTDE